MRCEALRSQWKAHGLRWDAVRSRRPTPCSRRPTLCSRRPTPCSRRPTPCSPRRSFRPYNASGVSTSLPGYPHLEVIDDLWPQAPGRTMGPFPQSSHARSAWHCLCYGSEDATTPRPSLLPPRPLKTSPLGLLPLGRFTLWRFRRRLERWCSRSTLTYTLRAIRCRMARVEAVWSATGALTLGRAGERASAVGVRVALGVFARSRRAGLVRTGTSPRRCAGRTPARPVGARAAAPRRAAARATGRSIVRPARAPRKGGERGGGGEDDEQTRHGGDPFERMKGRAFSSGVLARHSIWRSRTSLAGPPAVLRFIEGSSRGAA